MPQQINLCTPILQPQKQPFSANTMAMAMAMFLIVGGALCAFWVWELNSSSQAFQAGLSSLAKDRESLLAAIKSQQANTGPSAASQIQDVEMLREHLSQRERLLAEMRRGLLQDGQGNAARLRLVAETIPAQAWVTELAADENKMEVRGFTLVPAALNDWVARLSLDPVLKGQTLSAIKVERVSTQAPDESASGVKPLPTWAFTLVSTVTNVSAVMSGAKP